MRQIGTGFCREGQYAAHCYDGRTTREQQEAEPTL
jgi:hypothetical protein